MKKYAPVKNWVESQRNKIKTGTEDESFSRETNTGNKSLQEYSIYTRPCFSVILPTYNRSQQTTAALKSIWQQTFAVHHNMEVILIEDGSTKPTELPKTNEGWYCLAEQDFVKDGITARCYQQKSSPQNKSLLPPHEQSSLQQNQENNFLPKNRPPKSTLERNNPLQPSLQSLQNLQSSQKASPSAQRTSPLLIWLTFQHNRGVSAARNAGIACAAGKWIAFIDSDDLWHPDKLLAQAQFSEGHPEFHIHQCTEKWVRAGRAVNIPERHRKSGGDLFAASLRDCVISPSAVVCKRQLLIELNGFDEKLRACEDYDIWLRVTCQHAVGLLKEDLLTRFQLHPSISDQLSLTTPFLDRYRLSALKKFIRHSGTASQKNLASKELVRRCRIVAMGARKRGRWWLLLSLKILTTWGHVQSAYWQWTHHRTHSRSTRREEQTPA